MVELITLINDISTPVKLGWVGVLVWGAVQFMWYQRGRAFPEDLDVEPAADGWSAARLLALFKRSSDDDEAGLAGRSRALSIAPVPDLPIRDTSEQEADLGAAAGVALESLLDTDDGDESASQDEADAFAAGRTHVSYQSTMSH